MEKIWTIVSIQKHLWLVLHLWNDPFDPKFKNFKFEYKPATSCLTWLAKSWWMSAPKGQHTCHWVTDHACLSLFLYMNAHNVGHPHNPCPFSYIITYSSQPFSTTFGFSVIHSSSITNPNLKQGIENFEK